MLEPLLMGHAEKPGLKLRTITNLNAKPAPAAGQFMHQIGHGNHIYLLGSSSPSNAFCRFNLATRQYETLTSAQMNVSAAAATLVGDTIYYGTGFTGGTGTPQSGFWAYNILTNIWLARAAPTTTGYSCFAALNGKVYIIGGLQTQRLFREYDPTTNVWTTKANLPVDMYGALAVGYDGKIYVMAPSGVLYSWAPETNTWSTVVTLISTYYQLSLGFVKGKLYWPINRDLYCAEDITVPAYVKSPAGEPASSVNYSLAFLNDRIYSVLATGAISEYYE